MQPGSGNGAPPSKQKRVSPRKQQAAASASGSTLHPPVSPRAIALDGGDSDADMSFSRMTDDIFNLSQELIAAQLGAGDSGSSQTLPALHSVSKV